MGHDIFINLILNYYLIIKIMSKMHFNILLEECNQLCKNHLKH